MGAHWLLAAKISINQTPGQKLQQAIKSINHTLTSGLEFSIHLDSGQIRAKDRHAIAHGSPPSKTWRFLASCLHLVRAIADHAEPSAH